GSGVGAEVVVVARLVLELEDFSLPSGEHDAVRAAWMDLVIDNEWLVHGRAVGSRRTPCGSSRRLSELRATRCQGGGGSAEVFDVSVVSVAVVSVVSVVEVVSVAGAAGVAVSVGGVCCNAVSIA